MPESFDFILNQENIKSLCCICLCECEKVPHGDFIRTKLNENTLLNEFISKLIGIQILTNELNYIKVICNVCTEKFRNAYNLIEQARSSYKKLSETIKIFEDDSVKLENDREMYTDITKNIKGSKQFSLLNKANNQCLNDSTKQPNRQAKNESFEREIDLKSANENDIKYDDAVLFVINILDKSKKTPKLLKPKQYQERPHQCDICDKKFLKRSNLVDHLRLHANVKEWKCGYCGKCFVQSGNYKTHLRIHTKERPYVCTMCPKSYSQSSALKIHIRSHTKELIYKCDRCPKAFTNSSDLGKHKLIHDPCKKHKCLECQLKFTQKTHLKKHFESKHPGKDYKCSIEIIKPIKNN